MKIIKQLFGPNIVMAIVKIGLAAMVFFLIGAIAHNALSVYMMESNYGYPFIYQHTSGLCFEDTCTFSYWKLIADVLIWYLVSCFVVVLISIPFRKQNA